ncbi:MAG: hypothetical protein EZS28_028749 [Streblomastix strix]|uniref:Uncharacterized protein n=1 Tax=Streblomastix strix TaxID=222440 RepID=A0A5J4UZS2_9EUKA|nr:MAG: hypothetical protein EZS28_028749 [Streblomastix strix]
MLYIQMLISLILSLSVAFGQNSSLSNSDSSASHQSTSNCPCLTVDDPGGEQVCKQTEINPTDPDILDQTEKIQKMIKNKKNVVIEEKDEKEKQQEEQSTFKMNQIIIIVGVVLMSHICVRLPLLFLPKSHLHHFMILTSLLLRINHSYLNTALKQSLKVIEEVRMETEA